MARPKKQENLPNVPAEEQDDELVDLAESTRAVYEEKLKLQEKEDGLRAKTMEAMKSRGKERYVYTDSDERRRVIKVSSGKQRLSIRLDSGGSDEE